MPEYEAHMLQRMREKQRKNARREKYRRRSVSKRMSRRGAEKHEEGGAHGRRDGSDNGRGRKSVCVGEAVEVESLAEREARKRKARLARAKGMRAVKVPPTYV